MHVFMSLKNLHPMLSQTSETPNTIPNEEYSKSNYIDVSWAFLN